MKQVVHPIRVGLCGWGDHDLYPAKTPTSEKLSIYAQVFPVVELDSTYHAIPPVERMEKWAQQTPDDFQFVIKAYRELTGHGRRKGTPKRSWKEIVQQYLAAVQPMKEHQKVSVLLFQFPPWYDCRKEHVKYIRQLRDRIPEYTLAIEFRHQSWFDSSIRDRTLRFLEDEQLVHVVCDEPQAGEGSVPIVPAVTHSKHSLIRFHGRNVQGWNNTGQPNWRKVRYAYRYRDEELKEWVSRVHVIKAQTEQVTLLFNNNSQGDALASARKMMEFLSIEYKGFYPEQLKLF